ncbi:hypothetical protein [Streptomyces lunaelactis]|nr:hypothetical protein [Streptomyces lunaelactis]NUL11457.1 hypothetical protein [Streptomyces lunaelactis]
MLLPVHGSGGDVEPVVGLALRLRALCAEVRVWRVWAPPEFAGATSDRSW